MSTQPYKVLATFRPERWIPRRVGPQLAKLTARLGYKPLKVKKLRLHKQALWRSRRLHADLTTRTNPHSEATSWHQDGDLTQDFPLDHGLILWATNTPTELKLPSGEVVRPRPYEVIFVRNRDVHHRQPPDAKRVRWLFRQRVSL